MRKVGDKVWPPPTLSESTLTKIEILRRLRYIITDLKTITAQSRFLGEETAEIELHITQIEVDLAALIDDYMAAQIARYNRDRSQYRRR